MTFIMSERGSAWLERCVRDAEVGGSNPLAPTIFPLLFRIVIFYDDRLIPKLLVNSVSADNPCFYVSTWKIMLRYNRFSWERRSDRLHGFRVGAAGPGRPGIRGQVQPSRQTVFMSFAVPATNDPPLDHARAL